MAKEKVEAPQEKAAYEPEPVTVFRPDAPFRILKSLSEQGVYFIDLDSGKYVDGLFVNRKSIGLTFVPPAPEENKNKTTIGFLSIGRNEAAKLKQDTFEVDAILYFDYDGPEFVTGYLEPIEGEIRYFYFLKVWNDCEIWKWEEIISRVVSDLTITKNGQAIALAKFGISSSFVPHDPTQLSRQTIRIKGAPDKSAGQAVISKSVLDPQEIDEEDHHKFRPRF